MNDEAALRAQLIQTCLEMDEVGINQGTAGNASARFGGGLLITPTGVAYRDLQPDDIVFMHADGRTEGRLEPSSEWRFHLDILNARPDVGAVVHAHPTYATAIAIMEYEIPALHYMIGVGGGNTIRCARYATYGTAELSDYALEALEGRTACLLAHHGIVTTGSDLGRALWLAVELETLAKQYYLTLTLGGPPILDDAEIERVLEKFKTYGPRER
jgi:L-fuculose-phosphate aldolase